MTGQLVTFLAKTRNVGVQFRFIGPRPLILLGKGVHGGLDLLVFGLGSGDEHQQRGKDDKPVSHGDSLSVLLSTTLVIPQGP